VTNQTVATSKKKNAQTKASEKAWDSLRTSPVESTKARMQIQRRDFTTHRLLTPHLWLVIDVNYLISLRNVG